MAAMFSQSTGLPLKLPIGGNEMSKFEEFLPGAVSIGDILNEQGYNNTLMIGSDATFGGRQLFYKQHGDYDIFDYNRALEQKLIPEGYKVWWGYEDRKLFSFAKDKLKYLSKQSEPFNFTMLTVDTHHEDGYLCDLCENEFDTQYANVVSCSSRQVKDFIDWIKEQNFYKNTTIVIVGDHKTMDSDFTDNIAKDYKRTMYNSFINPVIDISEKHTKNREFTSLDIFPTTLASIGVEIEGNKLGLGVNLFSEKPTFLERFGDEFKKEINCKSIFYEDEFIYSNK